METEEIEQHLAHLKKKYHDARHHCYAYRLGMKGETSFSNDDGEPSHSAGTPILSAIRSAELSNIFIVVVRYFGGTKLGIRGLIEAYRSAAEDAISDLETFPLIIKIRFLLKFRYDQTAELNKLLHPFSFTIEESSYTDSCEHRISIPEENFPPLQSSLEKAGYNIEILT